MQDVLESILFGFSKLLHYKAMRLSLLIGLVATLFWSVVGYMMWGWIEGMTSSVIGLVPFSMLQSNGAWILSSFMWFILVLITFALILAFFGNLILERVSKEKYSVYSILLVFVSASFWTLVWMFDGGYIHTQLLSFLNWLPFAIIKESISAILALYFIYNAIIVSILLISSFLSERLLRSIHEKCCPYEVLLEENTLVEDKNRVKDILIYALLLVITFPLLFVPIVNFMVQIALWTWLIKDTFVEDSVALLIAENPKEKLQSHKKSFFVISFVTSLFNFIPILNVFGPLFGESAMFHYIRTIKNKEL